ncbi:hypothetical protein EOM09_02625 [bacterium]|nr:hypothetical protein [bacterium]
MKSNFIMFGEKEKSKIKTKEVAIQNKDLNIITPQEISELQGSLIELNNDKFDTYQRTSGIDLRTRLFNCEISSIVVLDTLVSFQFLPLSISPLTLQKKRLAVSLKGKGREEIVQIVQGKRENDIEKNGISSKIRGMFGKSEV